MILCSKKLYKEAFLPTRFLQILGWINNLSRPWRVPAEFPPRENTESQHLPWKSLSASCNPLNMPFTALNLHLHPPAPEQKLANRSSLTPGFHGWPHKSKPLRTGVQNCTHMRRRCVHSSGNKGYNKTTESHLSRAPPHLLVGVADSLLCKHRLPLAVWFSSPRTQSVLPNANGSLPLGSRNKLRS